MIVAVVGATGTGKSALALDLAEALGDAEIVNADAMQLYRGMDIGTAKVPAAERRGIPHHLLDVLDPSEEASVARYQADARAAIEGIEARGATAILVGGSGLYVASVIYGFDFPSRDPEIRARLESEAERDGIAGLHARLAAAAPEAAAAIGPHNARRIIRALEVIELEGVFTPGAPDARAAWRDTVMLDIAIARERLTPRLDARAAGMWESGLLAEAERVRQGGIGVTASRAIGYAQALAVLDGAMTRDAAVAETQALTRRFARRQVSWFRRYRDAWALDGLAPDLAEQAIRIVGRVRDERAAEHGSMER